MLIGPAITWESRHLKKRTIGNFNGHFSNNFSLVRVRNTLQSSWNCLCSRCVICSFFLRSSTSLFVIIPMSTALLSLLLSSDVTSIFANDYCVKVLAEVVTLSFKNLLVIFEQLVECDCFSNILISFMFLWCCRFQFCLSTIFSHTWKKCEWLSSNWKVLWPPIETNQRRLKYKQIQVKGD